MRYPTVLCIALLLAWLLWPAGPDAAPDPAPQANAAAATSTATALPLPAIPAMPVATRTPASAVPDDMQQ